MSVAETENPHAGQGSVLLDIGGDIGALVVTMPDAMIGDEVEIRQVGSTAHGHHHDGSEHPPHVAVVERPVAGGGTVPSLVFPELVEGSYELSLKGTRDRVLTVEVDGGRVATATWPG